MRKLRWTLARWALRVRLPKRFVEWLMPRFTEAEMADIHARAHAKWLEIQQCLAPEDRNPAAADNEVMTYLQDDRTLGLMIAAMVQWREKQEGHLFFDGHAADLSVFVLNFMQDDLEAQDDQPADQKPDSGAHSAVPPPWEEP